MDGNAAEGGPTLLWLRDDLRLADNPALAAAVGRGRPLAILYVLDELSPGIRPLGGAARWWLHGSLAALDEALRHKGQTLLLRRGAAFDIVPDVARAIGAGAVFWNRRYGAEREIDTTIKAMLRRHGVAVESFQANLLHEPWTIRTADDRPFRVFTPFWRACQAAGRPRPPIDEPAHLPPKTGAVGDRLDQWALLPRRPDWAAGLRAAWTPGEAGAKARLESFLSDSLARYAELRDFPATDATSRLSPHLRFGEISPLSVFAAVSARAEGGGAAKFLSELGWREFCWHLLFHQPELSTRNFQPRFDAFPWAAPEPALLDAWRRGRTGIPIIDAGMRQLWQTGWMHNRVRMIVASFLSKNLRIDWRTGEAWFWDTLVDADAANNPASWQWVAGPGADAAPYFRIFNPVLQGRKFDPDGVYVRHFVPELAGLAGVDVHAPPASRYLPPIVDLATSREAALAAFATLRAGAAEKES